MAKIIQTDVQSKALIKIKANLKSISSINHFLELKTDFGFISLNFGDVTLKMPSEKSAADSIAEGIRKDLIADTKKLAKTNSIELNDSDLAVMNSLQKKSSAYED